MNINNEKIKKLLKKGPDENIKGIVVTEEQFKEIIQLYKKEVKNPEHGLYSGLPVITLPDGGEIPAGYKDVRLSGE